MLPSAISVLLFILFINTDEAVVCSVWQSIWNALFKRLPPLSVLFFWLAAHAKRKVEQRVGSRLPSCIKVKLKRFSVPVQAFFKWKFSLVIYSERFDKERRLGFLIDSGSRNSKPCHPQPPSYKRWLAGSKLISQSVQWERGCRWRWL